MFICPGSRVYRAVSFEDIVSIPFILKDKGPLLLLKLKTNILNIKSSVFLTLGGAERGEDANYVNWLDGEE